MDIQTLYLKSFQRNSLQSCILSRKFLSEWKNIQRIDAELNQRIEQLLSFYKSSEKLRELTSEKRNLEPLENVSQVFHLEHGLLIQLFQKGFKGTKIDEDVSDRILQLRRLVGGQIPLYFFEHCISQQELLQRMADVRFYNIYAHKVPKIDFRNVHSVIASDDEIENFHREIRNEEMGFIREFLGENLWIQQLDLHAVDSFYEYPEGMDIVAHYVSHDILVSGDTIDQLALYYKDYFGSIVEMNIESNVWKRDQKYEWKLQLEKFFGQHFRSMYAASKKEEFNSASRNSDHLSMTHVNRCQSKTFGNAYDILREILDHPYHCTTKNLSSNQLNQNSECRIPDDQEIYHYIKKVIEFLINFAHEKIDHYHHNPKLEHMCVFHSEVMQIIDTINEMMPESSTEKTKTIPFARKMGKDIIIKILPLRDALSDIYNRLTKRLVDEFQDLTRNFWRSEFTDGKRNAKLSCLFCCSGTSVENQDMNQAMIQKAIDHILVPALQTILISHPISRKCLLFHFFTIIIQTYLQFVQTKRKKNSIILGRFHHDMLFLQQWKTHSKLLSDSEKQDIDNYEIFSSVELEIQNYLQQVKTKKRRSSRTVTKVQPMPPNSAKKNPIQSQF